MTKMSHLGGGISRLWCEPEYNVVRGCDAKTARTLRSLPKFLTMHRPNFCSECGTKIIRLHWHPWTSRRFCDSCSRRLRKERLTLPLVMAILFFMLGWVTGRAMRPAPPPLIIQRSANSPLFESQQGVSLTDGGKVQSPPAEEVVYICGARTKKGTPCSRRIHQPTRCWQHKGAKAMLPPEKLVIKE